MRNLDLGFTTKICPSGTLPKKLMPLAIPPIDAEISADLLRKIEHDNGNFSLNDRQRNIANSENLYIRPSEIHATWKNSLPGTFDSTQWVILDPFYAQIGKTALEGKLKKITKRLSRLLVRVSSNQSSVFDCDDAAFFLRGNINGNAIGDESLMSYCCGIAVLEQVKRLDQVEPDELFRASEHAVFWFIDKAIDGKMSLYFAGGVYNLDGTLKEIKLNLINESSKSLRKPAPLERRVRLVLI